MIVALDTTPIYTTRAGTARYLRGMSRAFEQIPHDDIQIKQLAWPVENISYSQVLKRVTKTLYRELVWARFTAPKQIRAVNADLLHVTQRMPIAHGRNVKSVATIHDCSVLLHPHRFRFWTRATARPHMRALTRSDRIMCISQFTADELMRLMDVPASKIDVVYLGNSFAPSDCSFTDNPPDCQLPDDYILFIGSLEPGKQLALMGDVYRLAKEKDIPLPPLVIVGERWAGVKTEGEASEKWIYAGRLPDGALLHCYKHARALVFPSRYEGFGLPVVEAMSLGCPVICSRVSSLPEVAGTAAVYAQHTPESYLNSLTTLLADDGFREEKIAAGREQSNQFSWHRCATETLDIYRSTH